MGADDASEPSETVADPMAALNYTFTQFQLFIEWRYRTLTRVVVATGALLYAASQLDTPERVAAIFVAGFFPFIGWRLEVTNVPIVRRATTPVHS